MYRLSVHCRVSSPTDDEPSSEVPVKKGQTLGELSLQSSCPTPHRQAEEGATHNEDSCNGDGRVHENCGGSTHLVGGVRPLKTKPPGGGGRAACGVPSPASGAALGRGRGRSLARWYLQLLTCFPQDSSPPGP